MITYFRNLRQNARNRYLRLASTKLPPTQSDPLFDNRVLAGPVDIAQGTRLNASIAMATFNGERFIEAQLLSIMAQTLQPIEVVICDDGSTDQTLAIVRRLAGRSTIPIRVYENAERLGYRRNFMKAGTLCRGSIVFFSDQDDLWAPDKLAVMLPLFEDRAIVLAYHNATVFHTSGEGENFDLYLDADQTKATRPDAPNAFHFSQGFTQAYRRSLHTFDDLWTSSIDHFEPDQPLAHDQWFFFLALLVGTVRYCPEKLARYRQHGANAYGAQQKQSQGLLARFYLSSTVTRRDERGLVPACLARARIASEIGRRVGTRATKIETLSQRYDDYARKLERRQTSADGPDLGTRLKALVENALDGAYMGPQRWRLRTKWLPQDILRAVFGGRNLGPESDPLANRR